MHGMCGMGTFPRADKAALTRRAGRHPWKTGGYGHSPSPAKNGCGGTVSLRLRWQTPGFGSMRHGPKPCEKRMQQQCVRYFAGYVIDMLLNSQRAGGGISALYDITRPFLQGPPRLHWVEECRRHGDWRQAPAWIRAEGEQKGIKGFTSVAEG